MFLDCARPCPLITWAVPLDEQHAPLSSFCLAGGITSLPEARCSVAWRSSASSSPSYPIYHFLGVYLFLVPLMQLAARPFPSALLLFLSPLPPAFFVGPPLAVLPLAPFSSHFRTHSAAAALFGATSSVACLPVPLSMEMNSNFCAVLRRAGLEGREKGVGLG